MKQLFYWLLCVALVAGCSKDKDDPEPETKTTVYTFGPDQYDQLKNLTQIQASADSIQVKEIIFQAHNVQPDGDSTYGWAGVNLRGLYNNALIPALNAAKNKGECRGTLKRVTPHEINREYAEKLEALGLKIIFDAETAAAQKP